ncbi:MAG: diadenylate cyclase CdaA [Erysipelotrichaceae bacterium]|nr:diadenylate cyclase CdaA [Erysipelotrichaceae bacterium]
MLDYLTLVQVMQALRMILDIVIVWILIYYLIKIVRSSSRTTQIFKGVIFLILTQAIAKYLGLQTLAYLTDNVMTWGFLALIIIFQPEIRSVLERFGKSNVFTRMSTLSGTEKEELVQALMDAASNLAESKTGALITIEQSTSLSEYIKTGIQMNSLVSAELLCSIFATTTPLHDGAVIIQGDKLSCASAYFPPTTLDLPSRYGARHRAAIGISELTDSVTIVVSEETGRVAIAEQGKLIQMNERKLRAYLNRVILNKETVTTSAVNPTSSESVSIDSLFKKEAEELEEEFKETSMDKPNVAQGQTSVIVIDENDEKVVDEPEVVHKAQMKTFKKADFKADTTTIPTVKEEKVTDKKETKVPTVEVLEIVDPKEKNTEPVKQEVEKKPETEKVFMIDGAENKKEEAPTETSEKTGIFEFLRKDKKVKKTDVELVVKEVAKEIHTTQQLKLKEIAEANEAAEAAKKKLNETKKLVIPTVQTKPQTPQPSTTSHVSKPKPIDESLEWEIEVTSLPPVKPIEITRVSRQQTQQGNQPTRGFLARRGKAQNTDTDGGDK